MIYDCLLTDEEYNKVDVRKSHLLHTHVGGSDQIGLLDLGKRLPKKIKRVISS